MQASSIYMQDHLGAGLLYQTEYRSELKLSGSTKSDVVRLFNLRKDLQNDAFVYERVDSNSMCSGSSGSLPGPDTRLVRSFHL